MIVMWVHLRNKVLGIADDQQKFWGKLNMTNKNFAGYNWILPKSRFMSFSEFCLNIFVLFKWMYDAIQWYTKKFGYLIQKTMAVGRMSFLKNFLNLILLKYLKVSLQKLILMKIWKMIGKIIF